MSTFTFFDGKGVQIERAASGRGSFEFCGQVFHLMGDATLGDRIAGKEDYYVQPITTDWERIELDYRAGIKTLRQIADENSITHGAINKRAKRDGWERDLSQKIKAKAEALVSKTLVSNEVSKERRIAERDVVDAGANAIVEVRLGQRRDIQRSRTLSMALMEELEAMVGRDTVELMSKLGELMRDENSRGVDRLNDLYHKIISLPDRVKAMKDLSECLLLTHARDLCQPYRRA